MTSRSVICRISRAKVSHVYGMSWCRCTTPLGKPVEPPLNSQKAMSSGCVSAGRRSPGCSPSSCSNSERDIVPSGSRSSRCVLGDDQLRVAVARVVGEVLRRVQERHGRGHGAGCASRRGTASGTWASRRGSSARGPRGRRRALRARCRRADAVVQRGVGDAPRRRSGSPPSRRRPASIRRSTSVPELFTSSTVSARLRRRHSTPRGVSRISGRKSPEANSRLYSGS